VTEASDEAFRPLFRVNLTGAVVFLLSDGAGGVNGTIITLDLGTMALPPW